ncbi:MAG: prepilin-type N-terminal cleavage/methylation domain-containing protein, partial [Candidatus Sericytochromatia bacterium]|nr:prepilin-type N-terminal cleavage/methylation domain-containing protein [Candidatus Sericytochromatia bacterium]
MIKRKNKGFSLIELLIVSLLSSIILIIIYNLNTG